MKFLLSLFSVSLLLSCNQEPEQQGYTLTGTLQNIPDSTLVILDVAEDHLDSTMVMDGKFRFSGKVEDPSSAILILPEFSNHLYLWVENSEIELYAESGKFEDAVISGSLTQKEDEIYMKRMEPVAKVHDSVYLLFMENNLSEARRDSLMAITNALRVKTAEITQQFIRDYPDSYMSLKSLNGYKPAWGKKKTAELYALISPELRETQKGRDIAQFIEVNKDLQIGDQYADLQVNNVNGEPVKLSENLGKYTLIEFWAAWCRPCRKYNPALVRDYVRFKDRGFEIYAVSLDDDLEYWKKAIAEDGLPWIHVSDLKGRESDPAFVYGVNAIPDNFLIDEHGSIIARKLNGENLSKKLEEVFGENGIVTTK